MKKCRYCGSDNDDAARYCSDCACSLDEVAASTPATSAPPPGVVPPESLRLVTFRKYLALSQAERDKSLLEAAGIPAFLAGENSASAGYGTVLGELRLQVQEADADRARRVLDEHEGFAPLPDDFIPPADPAHAGSRSETMEPTTNDTETGNKNIVISVVITLLVVAVVIALFNPPRTSSGSSSDRDRQAYDQRVRRAEALMTAQEQAHQRYLEFLTKMEAYQQRAEEDQRRFEKILATWEQQQQEYQKYLDGLQKKP
ncbi:MAG: DUF2007 domain-containing protein [Verrucomicrobiia bacterium]